MAAVGIATAGVDTGRIINTMVNIVNFLHTLSNTLRRPAWRNRRRPFTYAAIGDSTVEGVGASKPAKAYAGILYAIIKQNFKHATYYNFGVGGARAIDVLEGQAEQAIAVRPDLITLSVGANDIVRRTSLEAFRNSLTTLIERLQAETGAIIVITNVPNFSRLRSVPRLLKPVARHRIERFNAAILDIAHTHNLVYIDTFQTSTVFAYHYPEAVAGDNFHPSDFGYALWASTIAAALQDKLTLLKLGNYHPVSS